MGSNSIDERLIRYRLMIWPIVYTQSATISMWLVQGRPGGDFDRYVADMVEGKAQAMLAAEQTDQRAGK